MDIRKFSKPGKDVVIEIGEVEYLLTDEDVIAIEKGERDIRLIQLYDRQDSSGHVLQNVYGRQFPQTP